MINFSVNLPKRLKLHVIVERKLGRPEKSFLPKADQVMRAKGGNKTSFFFRHIFENEKIKKIVGTNLAFLIVASSLLPTDASGLEPAEINSITSPTILTTEQGVRFPTKEVNITQNFLFYHPGIDFDGVTGDAIYPIKAGKIKKVEYSRFGYGKSIIISHSGNVESLYAHLSKIEVIEGQEVTKDSKLGEMGATGRAVGDHLHLEIYENGKTINPLTVLPE
jgi:murein DD-endopeptidase MepM/ murein hydrolase activator NlpD